MLKPAASRLGLLICAGLLGAAAPAHAGFIAAIDEFAIVKNGNAFFTDPFTDNNPPPSAPNFIGGGPASYFAFGSGGSETGGKLAMDSTLGAYTLAGDGTARLRNVYTLNTNADPANTAAGLKPNHTFTVTGLFDLTAVPVARDLYGISLKDVTGPAPGTINAGQVWSLGVGRLGNGTLGIHLINQNYTTQTISVVASAALDFTHEQILLAFERDSTGNNLAHASWTYYDGGVANGGATFLGDASIFNYQQWVRTDFFTNQQTPVVPAPGTLALLIAGIALLSRVRRGATPRRARGGRLRSETERRLARGRESAGR
ncbi:MAG: hypothetical protein ACT4P4_26780 [Betaproteobacteria bacterium]